jgi:hypothetical protein
MHGIYEAQALGYAAFAKALLDLGRDVDEGPAGRDVEPEFFTEGSHTMHRLGNLGSCVAVHTDKTL